MKSYGFGLAAALLAMGCGKPRFEHSCYMDNDGNGGCSYTNVGTAKGSVCGTVSLRKTSDGSAAAPSFVICSGEVYDRSTLTTQFKIPSARATCGTPWSAECVLDFTSTPSDPIKSVPQAPQPTRSPPGRNTKPACACQAGDPLCSCL